MTLHDDSKGDLTNPNRASLVAWYGPKPAVFRPWLEDLQTAIAGAVGASFQPYPLEQIHATIIDLGAITNATAPPHQRKLEAWLTEELENPMRIRFGGCHEDDATELSRGQPRFERRFSIQGDKVVLIGWSDAGPRLGELRRRCESFGFEHRYHLEPGSQTDNDCYLRLGLLREPGEAGLDRREKNSVEHRIRSELAQKDREIRVEIRSSDVVIVQYDDETLPLETSRARSLGGDYAPPEA